MKTEEILNLINAYKEGKIIDFRFKFDLDAPSNRSYEWDYEVPSNGDYNWNFAMYDYRVKEEPKWRPYKSSEEFIKAQKKHGPYFKSYGQFYLPLMADRDRGIVYSDINGPSFINYQELFRTRTWEDGTRCGILDN